MENKSDPLIDSAPQEQSCVSYKWINIVLMVVDVILLAVLAVSLVFILQAVKKSKDPIPSPLDYLAQQYADSLPDTFLPDHYRVDPIYYFPATDQASRGTCWAFSTIYLFNTQYRAQGIRQGYLKEDEYVNFSVQAYASFLGNWCKKHPNEKVCGYGGFLINTTNDNQVEALDYFYRVIPELHNHIVPESVCPYVKTPSPDTDFECADFEKAVENNPIDFKVKGMKTAYDVRGVKQLLISAQRPLGIGVPMGSMNFYVPCEGSEYQDTEECREKYHPCPYEKDGSYCYILQVSARTGDSVFASSEYIERIIESGGHAMNIVGYNDNYQYIDRFAPKESIAEMKGTFIIHNSWGATPGHSIDFLLGKRTLENEEVQCPNHGSSLNWIPATLDCIKEKHDHKQCGTNIQRIRGHGRTSHADLLNCSSKICGVGNLYILQGESDAETVSLSNGLHKTNFINVTDINNPQTVTFTFPFWALGQIMRPVAAELVQNDIFDCGFYALPYKTLEEYRRRSWDLFDNFKVSDIELEFSPSSYLRAPESIGKNVEYLNKSTFTIPKVELDGPIPFDAIYKD
ncbi:hypothetical protein M9Y10_032875 [Tritrichomonas musculus]|uniref:Peptidase C1A papain C-terminal domain-containing protein n=1 Tax=Tritrichomonas musculus TaxID=1915356 RepID=A0ABR2H004_9EUKA